MGSEEVFSEELCKIQSDSGQSSAGGSKPTDAKSQVESSKSDSKLANLTGELEASIFFRSFIFHNLMTAASCSINLMSLISAVTSVLPLRVLISWHRLAENFFH